MPQNKVQSYADSKAAIMAVCADPDISIQPKLYYMYQWFMYEYTGYRIAKLKKRHRHHTDMLNQQEKIYAFQKQLRKL